jgi:hypothetical protein
VPHRCVGRGQPPTVPSLLHYLTMLYELLWLYGLECCAGIFLDRNLRAYMKSLTSRCCLVGTHKNDGFNERCKVFTGLKIYTVALRPVARQRPRNKQPYNRHARNSGRTVGTAFFARLQQLIIR